MPRLGAKCQLGSGGGGDESTLFLCCRETDNIIMNTIIWQWAKLIVASTVVSYLRLLWG